MGLEFTRGNNTRCPPFLVGGLMVMCLFLLCNWWSLSSQNFELLRQNDNLAEQLRINGEELRKCKDCQSQLAQQEVQIRQIKDSDQELQQLQLQCQKEKEMCQTEMESMRKVGESQKKYSETLNTEKKSLEKDLDAEKVKTGKLRKELEENGEKVKELAKDVEDKRKRIDELEKSILSIKGNSAQPIAHVLGTMIKKQDSLGNNEKTDQNGPPITARSENLETFGEPKNDDAGAEAADSREEGMLDTGINDGNN